MKLVCSIFDSRTSWVDHVTWVDVYLHLCTERSEVKVTEYVIIFVMCVVCGMMKGREKVKFGANTSPTPVSKHQGVHQI